MGCFVVHLFCILLISSFASCWPKPTSLGTFGSRRNHHLSKNNFASSNHCYYEQTLDHFSYTPGSYATFKQRYAIKFDYWAGPKSRAPIFVFLGAEAPIDSELGVFDQNAQQFNALLIHFEHRFYGESNPGGTMEAALKNATLRGYFNSAQALQDYAEVILHLKRKLNATESPVIVVGGSYGGMLAAWFRLKYPHVTLGALASSAPILYFDNIVPQDCFYSVITKSFRETSESCYMTIRNSWAGIDKLAEQPGGRSLLTKRFNLCSPVVKSAHLKKFLKVLYTEVVQYNPPNPNEDLIQAMCEAIEGEVKNGTDDLLEGIYAGVVFLLGKQKCYNVNETAIEIPKETFLGFDWQKCSEMVMPIGQTLNESMFPLAPFKLSHYIKNCERRYGVTPRAHWITSYFGGHDIRTVLKNFGSNIIFSNGLKDPYSCGGVLKSISNSIIAISNKNGSHTLDLLPQVGDPQWLIKQRKKEMDIIRGWIKEYYSILNKE